MMNESETEKLKEALAYVFEIADMHDFKLGEYEVVFDQRQQVREWRCFGCYAVSYSRGPDWKFRFEHQPGCRYIAARTALFQLDDLQPEYRP
jgi:hypothetical protein